MLLCLLTALQRLVASGVLVLIIDADTDVVVFDGGGPLLEIIGLGVTAVGMRRDGAGREWPRWVERHEAPWFCHAMIPRTNKEVSKWLRNGVSCSDARRCSRYR